MSGLQLRDYQEDILGQLRAGFAAGHRTQILVAPTGAGKTEMAISLLSKTAEKGNRAAMLMDRRVLCDQTSQRLQRYGIDHGVLMSGHWRYRPAERIQVCSAQTLEKRGDFPGLKLLVVDEAHQTREQTAAFIKSHPDVYVVGLTATPFTKGLGKVYSNVVSAVTTADLVRRGMLVPLRVYIAKEIDMADAKKVAGEWSNKDAEERGMKITGDIVTEWVSKTHEVFGGPRKTIVFCSGVTHGADLAAKFAAAGYNFVPLSYHDEDTYKEDAVKEFSKADSGIHGLIATDILTKGFDVPDVMIGVSARPFSKSLSAHIQQMGRVMRGHEGKDFALWLDHSGNYLRFRDDWDQIFENGVSTLDDGREKAKKEPTPKEKEAAKCPKCSHLWPSNADTCPRCGHVRSRRNDVYAVPGAMEELSGAGKELAAKKSEWLAQLVGYAIERDRKPGWAAFLFEDKFGHRPGGGRLPDPVEPSLEVRRWIKSNFIRKAKGKQVA